MVEGASLVWSVDKTKWPVRAALTPISAVSQVANLADQDDVGILAKEGAKGGGEV